MSDSQRRKIAGRYKILTPALSVDYGGTTVYTDTTNDIIGGGAMVSEALKAAQKKYDEANTVQVKLKLNRKTDADILNRLASKESKQGYIKALIRADLKENAGQ